MHRRTDRQIDRHTGRQTDIILYKIPIRWKSRIFYFPQCDSR